MPALTVLLIPSPQVGKAKPAAGASEHPPTSRPERAVFPKAAAGVVGSMTVNNRREGKGRDKSFRGKANRQGHRMRLRDSICDRRGNIFLVMVFCNKKKINVAQISAC